MTEWKRAAFVAITLCLFTALVACEPKPGPVREVTVIKEVPVPVHEPCPLPAQVPTVPKRLSEDHPVMPTDGAMRERILADKVLELFGYVGKAAGIMAACSLGG